jgi:hypothetical protein
MRLADGSPQSSALPIENREFEPNNLTQRVTSRLGVKAQTWLLSQTLAFFMIHHQLRQANPEGNSVGKHKTRTLVAAYQNLLFRCEPVDLSRS